MPLDSHSTDEDGFHEPSECEYCVEAERSCRSQCDCGECCQKLIIEVSLRDAEREPRIAAECDTIRDELGVIGYMTNDPANGYACHFFDRTTLRCTIYETRPLVCRVFDCDSDENPLRS